MKLIRVLILICCLACPVNAGEYKILYTRSGINASMPSVQDYFEKGLPLKNTITYTQVPRGLIVSIDESEFFEPQSIILKSDGKFLLDTIAVILEKFDNPCVVESHTDEPVSGMGALKHDWELTIMRANAIVDYLVIKNKLPYRRVFPLGYGEIMPFNDNVAARNFSDRRIDFVIFDNSIKR